MVELGALMIVASTMVPLAILMPLRCKWPLIARLYRKAKGQPAKLYYMGHLLMHHRHGLPVDVEVRGKDGRPLRKMRHVGLAKVAVMAS